MAATTSSAEGPATTASTAKGGNDAVYGEEGDDETVGGPGDDYVLGGSEEDRVTVWGDGLDFADGDYGADVVIGGAGDQIFGGTLNDKLSVRLARGENESAEYMNGGYDDDRIVGSELADHLQGNIGEDKIFGHGGDDIIRGGGSNDFLQGDGGNDSLFGENNRDDLHGSEGDDTLTGGEGRDDFWGDAGFDVCNFLGRSEKLNSCERREEDRRDRGATVAARGGGKPGGQSGSAPFVTSDGYPFPDKYSKIAGFKTVRELRRQGRDEASRQGFRTPGQAQRGRAGHGRPTARVRRGDHLQAQSPADRVGLHQHLLARLLIPGRVALDRQPLDDAGQVQHHDASEARTEVRCRDLGQDRPLEVEEGPDGQAPLPMMPMIDHLLTYLRRHHVGLVALLLVLGGTAYAAASVGSRDVRDNDNSLRGIDVRADSLTGRDVAKGLDQGRRHRALGDPDGHLQRHRPRG